MLLMFLRIVFSVITIVLVAYGFITKNFEYQAYMTLFLGLALLVMGIQEIQQNRKKSGVVLIIVFALSLYVAIEGFIY